MKIILEYVYTRSVKEETLAKDNIVEAFHAADYFQLSELQDFIMKTVTRNHYSPELSSKIVEIMPLTDDNALLNLLIEMVAITPLNTIEFSRLSMEGLECLLSCIYEKEEPQNMKFFDIVL